MNSPRSEVPEVASPGHEKLKLNKEKSDESVDSYRRDVLMHSSAKKSVLLPNFVSPPGSQRKQSPNYSEYRRRVNFVRNLSPKTPKRDILSPIAGAKGSPRKSGSQNLDLSGVALDANAQIGVTGENIKDSR